MVACPNCRNRKCSVYVVLHETTRFGVLVRHPNDASPAAGTPDDRIKVAPPTLSRKPGWGI
jgi:hypothetical protein